MLGLLCNAKEGGKSISNYGNIFCQPAPLGSCQGNSLIIKERVSVNVIFVGLLGEWLMSFQEKGTAEKKQAFLTNGTLLSVLHKWRLFSWKRGAFPPSITPSLVAFTVRAVWAAEVFPTEHCHCKPAVRLMGQETLCSQVMVCFWEEKVMKSVVSGNVCH